MDNPFLNWQENPFLKTQVRPFLQSTILGAKQGVEQAGKEFWKGMTEPISPEGMDIGKMGVPEQLGYGMQSPVLSLPKTAILGIPALMGMVKMGNLSGRGIPEEVARTIKGAVEASPEFLSKIRIGQTEMAQRAAQIVKLPVTESILKASRGRLGVELKAIKSALIRHASQSPVVADSLKTIGGALSRMGEEVGRGLSAFNIEGIQPEIQGAIANIDEALKRAKPEEAGALRQTRDILVKNIKHPGIVDALVEASTAMKLTDPLTHFRNLLGNLAAAVVSPPQKIISGAVNLAESLVTGKPQQRFMREGIEDVVGRVGGTAQGLVNAAKSLWDETYRSSNTRMALEQQGKRAIPGLAGRVIRFPFRALTAGDELFRGMAMEAEARTLAVRKAAQMGLKGNEYWRFVNTRTKRLKDSLLMSYQLGRKAAGEPMQMAGLKNWEQIQNMVSEALFQSPMGKPSNHNIPAVLTDAVNKAPVSRFILPFLMTPINITKWKLQRGVSGIFSLRNWRDLMASPGTRADALSRITLGSLISASMAKLAYDGIITGNGPKDRAKRDLWYASGWLPHSLKMTWNGQEVYVPLSGFDPFASYAIEAADMVEAAKENPKGEIPTDKILRLAGTAASSMTNPPYLLGLTMALTAAKGDEQGMRQLFPSFLGGTFLPTPGMGAVQRVTSPTVYQSRDVYTNPYGSPTYNLMADVKSSVQARVPMLAKQLPTKVNVLGEEVKLSENPFLRFFKIEAKPSSTTKTIAKELVKYDINLKYPQKTVMYGKDVGKEYLMPEEYRTFLIWRGQKMMPTLLKIIQGKPYQMADDKIKKEILQTVVDEMTTATIEKKQYYPVRRPGFKPKPSEVL